MRKMVNKHGTILNIKEHIILRNFWGYYVTDQVPVQDDPQVITALVMGFEQELGDVYLPEIQPYIAARTKRIKEVMPAAGWSWVD